MKKNGFTLVELLSSLALSLMVISLLLFLVGRTWRFYRQTAKNNNSAQVVLIIMERLGREIRNGHSFEATSAHNCLKFHIKNNQINYCWDKGLLKRDGQPLSNQGEIKHLEFVVNNEYVRMCVDNYEQTIAIRKK